IARGSRGRPCDERVETRRACGHAGSYQSAGGRLVGECDDAVGRWGCREELQRECLPAARRSLGGEYWVNGESDFVDEVGLEQGLVKSAESVHHEITAILLLELGHGADDILADDRGVVPVSALQGRGEHV